MNLYPHKSTLRGKDCAPMLKKNSLFVPIVVWQMLENGAFRVRTFGSELKLSIKDFERQPAEQQAKLLKAHTNRALMEALGSRNIESDNVVDDKVTATPIEALRCKDMGNNPNAFAKEAHEMLEFIQMVAQHCTAAARGHEYAQMMVRKMSLYHQGKSMERGFQTLSSRVIELIKGYMPQLMELYGEEQQMDGMDNFSQHLANILNIFRERMREGEAVQAPGQH